MNNPLMKNTFWFEKKEDGDFPFYNDAPIKLSWGKWITWIVLTIGTFFLYSGLIFEPFIKLFHLKENKSAATQHPFMANVILFGLLAIVLIILFLTYYLISGHRFGALFKKMSGKEFGFAALLGLIGITLIGLYTVFILGDVFHIKTVSDSSLGSDGGGITIANAILIIIQLMAEELWTIVPFLFILTLCFQVFSLNRKTSILLAWFVSSLIFGLYHIPSYDGNVAQAILVIGVSRLVLTFTYLRYKNIWASYTTHVFWDLIPVLIALVQGLGK